jgi:hypothetical protein
MPYDGWTQRRFYGDELQQYDREKLKLPLAVTGMAVLGEEN